jgi:hypothetical protein
MQIYYIDILFSHYPRVIDMYQVRISFCRICWLLFFLRGLLLPQLEFALVRAATYSRFRGIQFQIIILYSSAHLLGSFSNFTGCTEINMDSPSTTEPPSWASHPRVPPGARCSCRHFCAQRISQVLKL